MGRYYSGDIEGKFWFGLQPSDAPDRFGVTGYTPQYLEYYFEESDLENVEAEILRIQQSLGDKVKILDDFFEKNNGYTDKDITDLGITREEFSEWADLGLGIKIRDCIKQNGECSFTADL